MTTVLQDLINMYDSLKHKPWRIRPNKDFAVVAVRRGTVWCCIWNASCSCRWCHFQYVRHVAGSLQNVSWSQRERDVIRAQAGGLHVRECTAIFILSLSPSIIHSLFWAFSAPYHNRKMSVDAGAAADFYHCLFKSDMHFASAFHTCVTEDRPVLYNGLYKQSPGALEALSVLVLLWNATAKVKPDLKSNR